MAFFGIPGNFQPLNAVIVDKAADGPRSSGARYVPVTFSTLTPSVPAALQYRFIRVDGTGSIEMNVDGSSTPIDFQNVVPPGFTLFATRLNVYILDVGIDPTDFGGIVGGLTNGLIIECLDADDNLLIDFLDGTTLQQNIDWAALAGADQPLEDRSGGSNPDGFIVRWSINKSGGSLLLGAGEKFSITVQDDLTGLNKFRAMLQGSLIPGEVITSE